MGWASQHIAALRTGATVQFRPRGHSMRGKIESGQLCTVSPVDPASLAVGDIVLCKVNGREYLHLVLPLEGLLEVEHREVVRHGDLVGKTSLAPFHNQGGHRPAP